MDAAKALGRLKAGNEQFVVGGANAPDLGQERRADLAQNGQHPFAVVVACSDSRVVPEHLFNCGLGDVFTVRTAGNTVGPAELASVVYACSHLGCKLVVVLGHTQCGAVAATLAGGAEGAVGELTGRIRIAIGEESDPTQASLRNARAGAEALMSNSEMSVLASEGLRVHAALHHIDTGKVEFF